MRTLAVACLGRDMKEEPNEYKASAVTNRLALKKTGRHLIHSEKVKAETKALVSYRNLGRQV
jgi:hypothetical protein